jgi:hypothetical protein
MPDTETTGPTTAVSTEAETEAPAPEDDSLVGQTATTEGESTKRTRATTRGDTFPRSYVVKLPTENAGYGERARNAD